MIIRMRAWASLYVCARVRVYIPMELPIVAEGLRHELWICADRNAVDAVEGAHDAARVAFANARLERANERLHHVLLSDLQHALIQHD